MALGMRSFTYWAWLVCAAVILLFAGAAKASVIEYCGTPFNNYNPGPWAATSGYSSDGSIGWRIDIIQGNSNGYFGYHSETRDGQTAEGLGIYGGSMANEIGLDETMFVNIVDATDMVSAVELQSFTVNGLHYYTDDVGTPNYWECFDYSLDWGQSWTTTVQTTASGQNGGPHAPFTPGELTVKFAPGTQASMLILKTSNPNAGFVLNKINAESSYVKPPGPRPPVPPAVPEPGSMILFGSAAGLMGWYRRRKSAKKSS